MRVYTIGHGQTELNTFLDQLSKVGVTHVIDIRQPADAAQTGEFHPESISMELLVRGIRYANMGESLGAHPHISLDECERMRSTDEYRAGMLRLRQALMDEERVLCLLGSEPKADRCHRSKLVGEDLARTRTEVLHIEGGETLPHSSVMARLAQRAYAEDDMRGHRPSLRG